jgi:transposase
VFLCIEDLVPENQLERDIDRAIDFSFIYEKVKVLYSEMEWGKTRIDPIGLFKIVFTQYLFGIRSMRKNQLAVDLWMLVLFIWM